MDRHEHADGIRRAFVWLADSPSPAVRARRATAFVLALNGLGVFQVRTFEELCAKHQISPRTLRHLLRELREEFSLRMPGGPIAGIRARQDSEDEEEGAA